jgi:DnaJ-class molecular chaperone
MEPISTHYATLGVTQTAEASVIRAAYKALALSHHPDKHALHYSVISRKHSMFSVTLL